MKKYLYVLIAWMLPLCSIHAQAPVWNPDNGNGTFTNPIMWGDWPDPDVIRVLGRRGPRALFHLHCR